MCNNKYNNDNIFAKVLKKEVPNKTIFENDYILAFYDINPAKKIHAIVIPKKPYIDYSDFITNASNEEIIALNKGIFKVVNILKLEIEGYRLITNIGKDGGQEIPHLHFHILGGENIGKLVEK